MWYAAHIIQYVRFLDGMQDTYPCYENVVLVKANSADEALQAATVIGQTTYGIDYGTGFTWNKRPAEWVFAGIRKLIECSNMDVDMLDAHDSEFRPTHGTEITYSELEVDNAEELRKLVAGAPATIHYER